MVVLPGWEQGGFALFRAMRTCWAVLVFVLVACGGGSAVPQVEVATTVPKLGLSPQLRADTAAVPYVEALERLLASVPAGADTTLWEPADLQRYIHPQVDLIGLGDGHAGEDTYTPTLIALEPTGTPQQYLARVAWMGPDVQGTMQLKALYGLLAAQHDGQVRFARPIDHNTRNWQHVRLDEVRFIVPPFRNMDRDAAQATVSFNRSMAAFFGVEPLACTYYLCASPVEVFRIRGFEHVPNMYFAATGGQNESWTNTVFAGNDSERYDHELVHGYVAKLFAGSVHPLLEEGLCTFLGGSNERPYSVLRSTFQEHLHAHPDTRLADHLDPLDRTLMADGTALPYVLGAVLCERALRQGGRPLLFDLLRAGTDSTALGAVFHTLLLDPDHLHRDLLTELAHTPLPAP